MGTKIPPIIIVDPADPGDACAVCWGPGKDFGDGDTPDHLAVNFSGINKGPTWNPGDDEPLDGLFLVPQELLTPCRFSDIQDGLGFSITFTNPGVIVFVEKIGFYDLFFGVGKSPCEIVVFNETTGRYVDGTALIIIPEVA